MECERLKKLLRTWYIQVQDEALAPARMVGFMKQHIAECPVCLMDPSVRQEVEKITEIVLPPSKVRVTAPSQKDESAPAVTGSEEKPGAEEEGEEEENEELSEDEEEDDEDENEDDEEEDDDS